MSRAFTQLELQEHFLESLRANVDFWEETGKTSLDKLNGLAFSVLCLLDGVTGIPGFDIVVRPHPDDKEYLISNGENYYEDGMTAHVDNGHLHDLWYKKAVPE